MWNRYFMLTVIGCGLIPAVSAQAQSSVKIPQVELFATVTGKWVLNPARCRDIREDVRDARRITGLRDRLEDRQDQRVAACPARAYDFIPDAGQGPKYPVRVGRGRVPRQFRGQPMFINGDTIGPDGLPVETNELSNRPPIYRRPVGNPRFNNPAFRPRSPIEQITPAEAYQQLGRPQTVQPGYQQILPLTPDQPVYQSVPDPVQYPDLNSSGYQTAPVPQPTYRPVPAAPSTYRIINGTIVFD